MCVFHLCSIVLCLEVCGKFCFNQLCDLTNCLSYSLLQYNLLLCSHKLTMKLDFSVKICLSVFVMFWFGFG